jgi:hypothetical protein
MVTITLPPELEQAITEQAQRQGTTPELLAVEKLRGALLPVLPQVADITGSTMADFFAGYVGGLHSSEYVPGGAQLSKDTGKKFKELLLKRHRQDGGSC